LGTSKFRHTKNGAKLGARDIQKTGVVS